MTTLLADPLKELPQEGLREPLDWFFAEHHRHRQFCRLLEQAAREAAFDGPLLGRLVRFLRHDLPLHLADEEEDLFPLLRRRALPEDGLDEALQRLLSEHEADEAVTGQVADRLDDCLRRETAPASVPAAQSLLQGFAARELQHLALENAVILPIARLRLSRSDLARLSRGLVARRRKLGFS